jgi:hypothetical protein
MTKQEQYSNLIDLRRRKQRRHRLQLWRARKEGQLKALKHMHFLIFVKLTFTKLEELPPYLSAEIEKELKELRIIEEDLDQLKVEMGVTEQT